MRRKENNTRRLAPRYVAASRGVNRQEEWMVDLIDWKRENGWWDTETPLPAFDVGWPEIKHTGPLTTTKILRYFAKKWKDQDDAIVPLHQLARGLISPVTEEGERRFRRMFLLE